MVLRTWTAESPHNYDNNCRDVTVFLCPGATSFEVEFDERCETEQRQVDQSCINIFWLTFPFGLISCIVEATKKKRWFLDCLGKTSSRTLLPQESEILNLEPNVRRQMGGFDR